MPGNQRPRQSGDVTPRWGHQLRARDTQLLGYRIDDAIQRRFGRMSSRHIGLVILLPCTRSLCDSSRYTDPCALEFRVLGRTVSLVHPAPVRLMTVCPISCEQLANVRGTDPGLLHMTQVRAVATPRVVVRI